MCYKLITGNGYIYLQHSSIWWHLPFSTTPPCVWATISVCTDKFVRSGVLIHFAFL